jgi:phosphoglycerate dehydrogenase-like enzyme
VVTLHLVLSERSRHTIGAAELALMRPGAFLVNTSRGPLVDAAALETALREKRIAGAGLDVFDDEPLPAGASIAALPNTVLTPHLGYVTRSNLTTFYQGAVEDIAAYMAGAPIRVI